MKKTIEERVRFELVKIGKKNKFLGILIVPVLFVCLLFFHTMRYLGGNAKRLSMLIMTFVVFVVYSSFSFPLFIASGAMADLDGFMYDEGTTIALAEETEIDLADMEWLEDELLEDEDLGKEMSHGISVEDKYDAEAILMYSERKEVWQAERDARRVLDQTDVTFSKNDWKLILVNKQHPIPDDYTFELGTIIGTMKCDERIIDDLRDMLQAAKEDGVNLTIRSPYRTDDRQVYLFNKHMKAYMKKGMSYLEAYQLTAQAVTVPGASEHQIGLALDITCDYYDSLNEGFGETEAGKWLAENSYEFGFILRYPAGREYITGIEYEPWHFRYVGEAAATVIAEDDITLEEFWETYVK
ncbi:MAG: M15 family metallopeptidase [Lachnospiraceae bacterium]|nr:M15 family metallopeptidase [Lachnospiraceae bacterium]